MDGALAIRVGWASSMIDSIHKLACIFLACAVLEGCVHRTVSSDAYPYDYRDRHPIIPAGTKRVLNVHAHAGALDVVSARKVFDFGREYLSKGGGRLEIAIDPRTISKENIARDTRGILAAAGVPSSRIRRKDASSFPGQVRLNFQITQTMVDSVCGTWSQSLSADINTWTNRPYWDQGCATQTNLLNQVADSRDLFSPRGWDKSDAVRRQEVMEKWRSGEDTATEAKNQSSAQGVRSELKQ